VNLNNVNIDRKRLLTVAASEGLLTWFTLGKDRTYMCLGYGLTCRQTGF
jgi:hypothetical protein